MATQKLALSVLLCVIAARMSQALDIAHGNHHRHLGKSGSNATSAEAHDTGSSSHNGSSADAQGSNNKSVHNASSARKQGIDLRFCNAYPYDGAMDVYHSRRGKMTKDTPMPYKTCRDFRTHLRAGDQLLFKVGTESAGIFTVSQVPRIDALLLLVIHRHDTASNAAAFESHVFANLLNSQVVVIDTYRGKKKSKAFIMDAEGYQQQLQQPSGGSVSIRKEKLPFNSVVAVNQGAYEVELSGSDGNATCNSELVALDHHSYVVLRMGVEAESGDSYPEALTVYPHSTHEELLKAQGAATGCAGVARTLLLLAVAVAARPLAQ